MDPKVTLLKPEWNDWTLVSGKRRTVFVGGIPRTVPMSVALRLKKFKDGQGNPLFKVEDCFPTQDIFIKPNDASTIQKSPEVQKDLGVYQRRLIECLLPA